MIQTTVIIISLNRQLKIQRYLDFLGNYNIKVIIVDGSSARLFKINNFRYGSASFRYIHHPGEKTYLDRICLGLKLVETKYFCLMDDSDILLPSGLSRLEKILQKSTNLCVTGQVYNLNLQNSKLIFNFWGKWSKPLSLSNKDSYKRIIKVIQEGRTGNSVYVIAKTKISAQLIRNIKIATKLNKEQAEKLSEIIWTISILSIVKLRKIEIPFWIRSGIQLTPNEFVPDVQARHKIMPGEIEFIKKYLRKLSEETNLKLKISELQINQITELHLRNYDESQKVKEKNSLRTKFLKSFKLFIYACFPAKIIALLIAIRTKGESISVERQKIEFEDRNFRKVFANSYTVQNDLRIALSYWYFRN